MEFVIENGVLISYKGDDKVVCIPSGVSVIGNHAFWMMKTIEEVVIPEGVVKIKNDAFRWCANIKKVSFPESLEHIDKAAFYGCPRLSRVDFPKSLKFIGDMSFGFTGIKNIIVPETVEYISSTAFHPLIHPLYTNESWEDFSSKTDYIFNINDCVCLKKGILEKYTPRCMFGDEEEEIYIPHGVKGIGNTAFDKAIIRDNFNRWSTKKIFLPDSVKQIGKLTFNKCKDIIICASPGTYAEKYAKEHGLTFEETDY